MSTHNICFHEELSRHTKKGPYGLPDCDCLNAHVQSPWATDMGFLPNAF